MELTSRAGLRRVGLTGLGFLALAGVFWLVLRPALPPPSADGAEHFGPAARPAPDERPESSAAAEPLPQTLRGTRPSGGLTMSTDGHFVPDRAAVLFFEYFLSASRDEPVDRLLHRIRQAIGARLDPPADAEALAFFDDYLEYLESGESEFDDPSLATGVDLERRLQWIREHRREHFGVEVAEALFGDEENASEVYAAMRRVRDESGLTLAERASRLAALEAELPARVHEARERAAGPLRLARDEHRLREQGADPEEIHGLRVERFGDAAAERLRARDLERDVWDQRVLRYREARLELSQGNGLNAPELDALRRDHFSAEEIDRVVLLDRFEARAESEAAISRTESP